MTANNRLTKEASSVNLTAYPAPALAFRRPDGAPLLVLLNVTLANTADLKSRVMQARWFARKSGMQTLASIYDDLNDDLDLAADLIGQRIVALGGQPIVLAADVVRLSGLPSHSYRPGCDHRLMDVVEEAMQITCNHSESALDRAIEVKDQATVEVLQRLQRRLRAQRKALAMQENVLWA